MELSEPIEQLEQIFLGNSPENWTYALLTAAIIFIVLRIIQWALTNRFAQFVQRTDVVVIAAVGHAAHRTSILAEIIVSLYLGSRWLVLPPTADQILASITIITLLLQVGVWGNALIAFWLARDRELYLETNAARVTTYKAVGFLARLLLFSILLLMTLDNLGVQVTALIASLGIGGIAVALAVQNILSDLFASLSIVLDKPFVIGDFIIVGEFLGTIEHIGLKTTRVRSLSGEQLIFSNTDLLNSRIRNFKRMEERRVVFSFGVVYATPAEQLSAIPPMIREIIEAQEQTRFDRAHFQKFGDYSLDFEVVYFVLSPDYNLYMDIQQNINLEMFRRFADQKIEFAFPTQTLNVANGQHPASQDSVQLQGE